MLSRGDPRTPGGHESSALVSDRVTFSLRQPRLAQALLLPGERLYARQKYGGVTFENYRGWIRGGTDSGDTVTPFIGANDAHFFPLETPNLYKTFFAPTDYIETVNTLGLPRYAKAIPSDNGKSVRLEMQTNPLSPCL